jgi:hypothetical protein
LVAELIRYLPVLFAACIAIISGLIGAVGLRALAEYEKLSVDPTEMTLEKFFNDRPEDKFRFLLTDLQHGASVYPDPVADDGDWKQVYVCLFPKNVKRLGKNYASVIVKIDDVKSADELSKMLEDGQLDVFFWSHKQHLPDSVSNRMANKYSGMRFEHCLFCEAHAQPPSPDYGNSCIYAGTAGVSLSFMGIISFYMLRMILSRRSRMNDWKDEDAGRSTSVGLRSSFAKSQNPAM